MLPPLQLLPGLDSQSVSMFAIGVSCQRTHKHWTRPLCHCLVHVLAVVLPPLFQKSRNWMFLERTHKNATLESVSHILQFPTASIVATVYFVISGLTPAIGHSLTHKTLVRSRRQVHPSDDSSGLVFSFLNSCGFQSRQHHHPLANVAPVLTPTLANGGP